MARYFSNSSKPESAFKRIQRFLKEVTLPRNQIAMLILGILGFKKDEKLTLIFDRTKYFISKHRA